MENLYEVLGCDETASYEELKSNYQKLILQCHPDKSAKGCLSSGQTDSDKFITIDNAWKILRDPELRRQFDSRWKERCLAQTWPIQEEVDIEEFYQCEEAMEPSYTYDCRCGGQFILNCCDIDIKFDIVCCDSCSLSIRIIYDASPRTKT